MKRIPKSEAFPLFALSEYPQFFNIIMHILWLPLRIQSHKGTTFAHLKKEKWFFSKLTRTSHCKERFLHHKVLKRKFSSFLKFLLNKLILKSPCRLDQKSPSSHWLTKCLPIFMNYVLTWSSQKRYVGSPSKTRSQLSEWPLNRSNSWIMSRLHPPKKGT